MGTANLTAARCEAVNVKGLPCHRLVLPSGDSVLVAEHGAHLLSWSTLGRERLYLSERSHFDGRSAIRGGVPVCWPQFNQRGPLSKHGFARNLPWRMVATRLRGEVAELDLQLKANAQTQALWPHDFCVLLTLVLRPASVRLTLCVHNSGSQPFAFTGALHSYFQVDDIAQTQLHGLQSRPEWDALSDAHALGAEVQRFGGEFDRVYGGESVPLQVQSAGQTLRISQSPSWGQTVVWNPGAEKGAALADMPADGYRHMLCVEAAQVYEPIELAPGERWQGWQQLDAA